MTAWMYTGPPAPRTARESFKKFGQRKHEEKPPLGPPSGHQATGGKNSKLMRSDKQLRYSFACLDGGMAAWMLQERTETSSHSVVSIQFSKSLTKTERNKVRWLGPHLNILYNHIPTHICHSPSTYPPIRDSGSSDRCIKNSMKDMRLSAVISVMSP